MVIDELSITILLFSNVKTETRKAEIKATIRPSIYFISALKIIETPNKDKIPSINSYIKNFFLKNKGSISEVKNAAEDIIETVIETLEILIAWKKVIQWMAIIIPQIKIFIIIAFLNLNLFLLYKKMNIDKNKVAIPIL